MSRPLQAAPQTPQQQSHPLFWWVLMSRVSRGGVGCLPVHPAYGAQLERRRRAPRREGTRITLRVPDEVMQAASALARELGTTANDAIVRLAQEGAVLNERRRAVESLARARREAVANVEAVDADVFPAVEEMRAAMLSGRAET